VSNPKELRYTSDHEWVRVAGDTAQVGITDHAQDALGDIVFVDVPEVGAKLDRGEEACNIESVKAAAPVYAPFAGTVTEVNTALDETPELLNQKPYDTFIFSLHLSNPQDADSLLTAEQYEKLVAEEKER